MSEPTRKTAPSGGSKDVKIERYDQIPPGPLAELAARYGIGHLKYADKDGLNNWLHGYPWSWSYRALIGHANAFWAGEDVDPHTYAGTDNESPYDEGGELRPGVTHLAAVAWHAFALLEWMETHPENDDRVSTVKARLAAGLSPNEDGDPVSSIKARPDDLLISPDPERIEEIQEALRDAGLAPWSGTKMRYVEDGMEYPIFGMYDLVTVKLDDGRVIEGCVISVREVGSVLRYDVGYNGRLARLSFVPPSQIVAAERRRAR